MSLTKLLSNTEVEELSINGLPMFFNPDPNSQQSLGWHENGAIAMRALNDDSPRKFSHILVEEIDGQLEGVFIDVRQLAEHFDVSIPVELKDPHKEMQALSRFLRDCHRASSNQDFRGVINELVNFDSKIISPFRGALCGRDPYGIKPSSVPLTIDQVGAQVQLGSESIDTGIAASDRLSKMEDRMKDWQPDAPENGAIPTARVLRV